MGGTQKRKREKKTKTVSKNYSDPLENPLWLAFKEMIILLVMWIMHAHCKELREHKKSKLKEINVFFPSQVY